LYRNILNLPQLGNIRIDPAIGTKQGGIFIPKILHLERKLREELVGRKAGGIRILMACKAINYAQEI